MMGTACGREKNAACRPLPLIPLVKKNTVLSITILNMRYQRTSLI